MDSIQVAIIILAAVMAVAVIILLLSRRRNEHEKVAEKWADYKRKEIAGEEKERRRAEEARRRTISILGGGVEYSRIAHRGLLATLLKVAAVAAIFAGVAAASYWVLVSGPYGGAVKKYAAAAGDYSSEIEVAKSAANGMLDRIQCMLNPGSNVCYKSAPEKAESGIYISDMRSTDVRAGYQASLMFTVRNAGETATNVLVRASANGAPPMSVECEGSAARPDGCFYDAIERGGYRRVTAMFDVPCVAGGSDYTFGVSIEYNGGAKKTATLPSQTAYQTGPGRTC